MSNRRLSGHRRLQVLTGVAVVALVGGTAATAGAATSSGHGVKTTLAPALTAPKSQIHYAINQPLCATHVKPGDVTCFAMRRVTVKKGTPGARPYVVANTIGTGPAGGYTPADLAAAYKFNPKLPRSGQTIGIVDWFDDPKIASDLNAFDRHYGLSKETATSFRKVNQIGKKSPLPEVNNGSSGEITLDVESARAVCNTCKILLVEAAQPLDSDLSIAENTAVRLGSTEVSNSFGGPEDHENATTLKGFNHPGVVITASTGDDGWFAWDVANEKPASQETVSSESPEFPASDPDVVAVGGTALTLNSSTGAIVDQSVWNENATDDQFGHQHNTAEGAGGSGCSTEYQATSWQLAAKGEAAAGCGSRRAVADVSLDADPESGFDIYDTQGTGNEPWFTVGGTSLSSPLLAAMWALEGGSGGAAYPSRSLYTNALSNPALVYDVTEGGNGFCGGDADLSSCESAVSADSNGATTNPNDQTKLDKSDSPISLGDLDCSFPRFSNGFQGTPTSPPSPECNATAGFDGPSGVGAPTSPSLLTSTSPTVALTRPSVIKLHKSAIFKAKATAILSGTHITGYKFQWGDGKVTSTTKPAAAHTYTKKGHYTVTLTVTDSAGQQSIRRVAAVVGEPLHLKLFGTAKIAHGRTDRFAAEVSDPNSGAKVSSVVWHWGDGHTSKGINAKHVWHRAGKYKITIVISDNTGIKETFVAKQTVT